MASLVLVSFNADEVGDSASGFELISCQTQSVGDHPWVRPKRPAEVWKEGPGTQISSVRPRRLATFPNIYCPSTSDGGFYLSFAPAKDKADYSRPEGKAVCRFVLCQFLFGSKIPSDYHFLVFELIGGLWGASAASIWFLLEVEVAILLWDREKWQVNSTCPLLLSVSKLIFP